MRLVGWIAFIATAITLGASTSFAAIDMKVGYPTTADPQHDYAVKFVAEVKKRTNGEIAGRVFPTSQLGKIPRQIEGIQLGTQEAFFAPPGFLQGVNKAFQVADVPGFFADHMHAHRTLNDPAFRIPFNLLGESKGVISGNLWVYDGAGVGRSERRRPQGCGLIKLFRARRRILPIRQRLGVVSAEHGLSNLGDLGR